MAAAWGMPPAPRALPAHDAAHPTLYRASLPFAQRLEPLLGRIGFALSSTLSDRRVWVNSRLLAWVLLPDGWQGLLQPGPLENPQLRLDRARDAGTRAWVQIGGAGPLWAFGGHLLPLAGSPDAREAARALVGAPIRAGLVGRIGDYPFWDAVWLDASVASRSPSPLATTT